MKKIYFTLLATMALTLGACSSSNDPDLPDPEPTPALPQVQNLSLNQVSIRKAGLAIIAALCCKDSLGILIMNHNGRS